MHKIVKIMGGGLGVILLLVVAVALLAVTADNLRIRLPVEQTEHPEHEWLDSFPAALHVEGRWLVTSNGEVV